MLSQFWSFNLIKQEIMLKTVFSVSQTIKIEKLPANNNANSAMYV